MKALNIIGYVVAGIVGWLLLVVGGIVVGFWYQSSKLPPSKPTVLKMKIVYVEPAASGQPTSVSPPGQ